MPDSRLVSAIKKGDKSAFELALREEPKTVHQKSRWKRLPLSLAIGKGQHYMVQRLLEAGADPLAESRDPVPALAATLAEDCESLRILAKHGAANPDRLKGRPGALHYAVWLSRPKCVRALLDGGVKLSFQDGDFTPAIEFAAMLPGRLVEEERSFDELRQSHLEILQMLVIERSAVDFRSANGRTPLMIAASVGSASAVEMLINAGAHTDIRCNGGRTMLHWFLTSEPRIPKGPMTDLLAVPRQEALHEDRLAILDLLLATSPDLADNSPEPFVHSWTRSASSFEDCELLGKLLSNGLEVKLRDAKGKTALHLAPPPIIARFLLNAGVEPMVTDHGKNTALHRALLEERIETAEAFLELGYVTNAPNAMGKRPRAIARTLLKKAEGVAKWSSNRAAVKQIMRPRPMNVVSGSGTHNKRLDTLRRIVRLLEKAP